MATEKLQPIFVNNQRVQVEGDPKPTVRKIVKNAGKTTDVEVFRLSSQEDRYGRRLKLEDIIDRENETNPVYLKLMEKQTGIGETGATGLGTSRETEERQGIPSQGATPPGTPESPEPMPPPATSKSGQGAQGQGKSTTSYGGFTGGGGKGETGIGSPTSMKGGSESTFGGTTGETEKSTETEKEKERRKGASTTNK